MIISKTPYRVSFFGGGTDYPEWYKVHGGEVLSTTIDCHSLARVCLYIMMVTYLRDLAWAQAPVLLLVFWLLFMHI